MNKAYNELLLVWPLENSFVLNKIGYKKHSLLQAKYVGPFIYVYTHKSITNQSMIFV